MIVPTVGRIVWVSRLEASDDVKQPEPAMVTYVHSDRYINVAGYSSRGVPFALTSLYLVQEGEAKPEHDFAYWMPYQQKQASEYANKVPR